MICAIHQPQFIPWLGYFDKIARSDVFVFLDTVQFKKNEYQNRNRIFTPQGPRWLTVPVSFDFGDPLNRVRIAPDPRWRKKMLRTVEQNYRKAPGFAAVYPTFEALILESGWDSLAELNGATVLWLMELLALDTPTVRASELGELAEEPTLRLIDICRKLGADTYLSGRGGRDYLRVDAFERNGIDLLFQDFQHPTYRQADGRYPFISHLSALDWVMWHGPGQPPRWNETRKPET